MASVSQQTPYQCDQCGATNIVAAPILYQQGTHSYSGLFNHGTTQSISAQAAAPPRLRGYIRSTLVWGPCVLILSVWAIVGFSAVLDHPTTTALGMGTVVIFLFFDMASLAGMFVSFRKIARYNRDVYPRLYWNWEHTYFCRRCGRSLIIPS